jgi:glycosyltransferase involved in cell wall biosynthesis
MPSDLARVGRLLDKFPAPRRLLVQWVPHGFGWRSLNVPFCLWLWQRAARFGEEVDLMVHEPGLAFRGTWKQRGAAVIHRLMTAVLLRAAKRVWVGSSNWEPLWRPFTFGKNLAFGCLPVPSNVPVVAAPAQVLAVRGRFAGPDDLLVGHFGTFGNLNAGPLVHVLPRILAHRSPSKFLLLGRGGQEFRRRILQDHPALAGRIVATGGLSPEELSCHLLACDLMVQPYPGGVDTRRGSMMAVLAHGRPTVTTKGPLTEAVWMESPAACLVPEGDWAAVAAAALALLEDPTARSQSGEAARVLYADRFDLRHTIHALRAAAERNGPTGTSTG